MKRIFFAITFLIAIILISCSSYQNKNSHEHNKDSNSNKEEIRKCWVKAEYLECINNLSAKTCEHSINNPLLILDSLKYAWIKCANEYCIYDIKKDKDKYFFKSTDSTKYELELINNDTLMLNGKIYISNKNWDSWDFDLIGKVTGDVFKEKYDTYLKKIYISTDTILLSYNPFWQIYFLKNKKSCKDMYIVDFQNDSISVYDFELKCKPLTKEREEAKYLILKFPLSISKDF